DRSNPALTPLLLMLRPIGLALRGAPSRARRPFNALELKIHGFGITYIRALIDFVFHRDAADGFYGHQDFAFSARSLWFFYDLPCYADAKHDDVLFHRNGQAGQRPGRSAAGRTSTHSTHEGLQSEGLPAGAVGNALHDGDDDHRRRRSYPSVLDTADF